MPRDDSRPRLPSVPSDHWDGKRFFNPHADTDKGPRDLLRFFRERGGPGWPAQPVEPPKVPEPLTPARGEVAVTFIGQATFLVRVGGATFLTDPVFSDHAGPFGRLGPKRARPPAVRMEDLPPVDAVLVSHNHYDHLDAPSLRQLARRLGVPLALSGLGNGPPLRRAGFELVEELDWWDEIAGPGDTRITFVPAQHWSARGPFDRRRTLWGSFIVRTPDLSVYFAGDTGYGPHFQETTARLGPVDVALLPIGAYEPRWFMASQHMNPAEAVRAHRDLGAHTSVAMHFGTFQLTTEPVHAPIEDLGTALAEQELARDRFLVPPFGETLRLRQSYDERRKDEGLYGDRRYGDGR